VNVEALEPFKDVYRARYLPLNSLVDAVNSNLNVKLNGHWFPKVDQQFVLRLCEEALTCYEYNPEIIDAEIINELVTAIAAGTEVIVISTVPDKKVFDAAENAIRNRMHNIPGFQEEGIIFVPAPEKAEWLRVLKERGEKEPRYTYVIHDTPEKEFGVTKEDGYDEWAPHSSGVQNLATVIQAALARERQHAPLNWLRKNNSIDLRKFRAVGNFMVFADDRRTKISSAVEKLKPTPGKPTCVFLGGPPGSGKSFFVKQFINEHYPDNDAKPVISNISGVRNLEDALKKHVNSIIERDSQTKVAFIDEIDTSVFETLAFRFLLAPMEGTVLDEDGFEKKKPFGDFTWFFAGSAGTNREDFHKLADQDRKVRDFTSRIPHWIELPGASTPFDAMFMAITLLKDRLSEITKIEKKVLLLFAKTPWRDARHLSICVDAIVALGAGPGKTVSFNKVVAALDDGTQVSPPLLLEVGGEQLNGYLEIA
jgi:hypothetical protein